MKRIKADGRSRLWTFAPSGGDSGGRPRKHRNNAEKQRAYRTRLRAAEVL